MNTLLKSLFATLSSMSYPEQMRVSQAYTDLTDPYDTYPDALEMGLFDPIRNPNEDIIGGLQNEMTRMGDDDYFGDLLRQAINSRNKYGN